MLEGLLCRRGHHNADRVVEVTLDHTADPIGHRGGCQRHLGLVGQLDDALHVRREAGIEHLVTLVEDEQLDPAQRQAASRHHVEEATRRPDHEVDAAPQRLFLRGVADPAVDEGGFQIGAQGLEHAVDLDGELTRGRDHQGPRAWALDGDQPFNDREDEGERLPGAGGGLDNDIASAKEGRDGFDLHGHGGLDRVFRKGGQ